MNHSDHSQETIGFIHGFGATAEQWRPLIDHLPMYQTISFDLPGHGESSDCLSSTFAELVDNCLSQLDMHDARPITLVGHSMGGVIAQAIAIQYPHVVKRMLLLSTAPSLSIHPQLIEQLCQRKIDSEFIRAGFVGSTTDEIKTRVTSDLLKLKVGDGNFLNQLDLVNFSTHLPQLRLPVINVYSKTDPIVSPRRSRQISQLIGHAQSVELTNCGHYAHLEQVDVLLPIILALMNDGLAQFN